MGIGLSALSGLAVRPTEAAEPAKVVPTARPGPITTASLEQRFNARVKPLLATHCNGCHANGKQKGDFSLDPYTSLVAVQSGRQAWVHVADVLRQKLMPPDEKPQPTHAEFDTLVTWVDDALAFCDCTGPRDPGRVATHRLNRTEYNNTVRDLLGVDVRPADDFPADDTGYGFDNIADVLTMSPLLAEKYLAAAERVMAEVVPTTAENPNRPRVKRYGEADLTSTGDRSQPGLLAGGMETVFAHAFAADGRYEVRVRATQRKIGDENARLSVRIDGREVGSAEVTGIRDKPVMAKVHFTVKAGARKVSLALANPKAEEPPQGNGRRRARTIAVEQVEVEGPFDAAPPPPSAAYRKLFVSRPGNGVTEEAAARAILQRFATRAYRRPAAADEVDGLMKLFRSARADGEPFEQSVRLAVTGALVSPQFLFRVELDPPAAAGADPAKPAAHLVGEYELASRLSYFLWSSTPDDELMALAANRKIRDPQVLEAQVRRMLADPRSAALVENFAGQWLELRNLDDHKPDAKLFPAWDDKLRASMRRETELFVDAVIREDRSILDLLNGDYTFLNERLARHYGIPNVKGDDFRRVSLAGTKRAGVLTQAAVLTVTATPTRTSPVKRGKFVLENVLGTPPPPPPPDVAALSEDPKDLSKSSLKARLEAHRKDPNCAVCHVRMDAIGFALENFDAIGAWREKDGKFAVDATGVLPDGGRIDGADGLRKMLLARQDEFVSTVVRKLLTYALGRGLEHYDQCAVKDVEQAVRLNGYKFSSLVMAVVKSDPFQKRRLLRPDEVRARQETVSESRAKKDDKR